MGWLAPTRPRPNDRLTTEEVDATTLRGEDRGPRRGAPTSRRDRCLCGDGRSPSACHARVRPITEKGWCSAWDSGWPEDLELERCRGRHHLLERGWFGGRRRERQRLGRLGEREQEVLESGRLDHEQEARLLGAHGEGVRHISRAVDERPFARNRCLAIDPERQLARENVEPLVLSVVDMERRAIAPRRPVLGHRDPALGGFSRCLDDAESTEKPACVSFALQVGDRLRACVRGHRPLLFFRQTPCISITRQYNLWRSTSSFTIQ